MKYFYTNDVTKRYCIVINNDQHFYCSEDGTDVAVLVPIPRKEKEKSNKKDFCE